MREQLGIGYVVAVPKSQQIKSLTGIWRTDQLIEKAPDDAWQRLSCGDGAWGPRTTTGPRPSCPPTSSSTLTRRSLSEPGEIAYYLAYAPVGVEITELAQVAGSRWATRSASRPRRTSAAWTNTRSAAIPAGTGTSPWPCSPTPSSPLSPPRPAARKGGPQKRISPRPAHRGRDPAPAGRSPAALPTPSGQTSARPEPVSLAQTPPSRSPPLPLPKRTSSGHEIQLEYQPSPFMYASPLHVFARVVSITP
jgi:hypothetical protein